MFSARSSFDRTPNRLARLVAAKRARGEPLIDLTESNPTRAALLGPPELLARLADPAGAHYLPDPFGLPAAREAVAADYRRRGTAVGVEQIVLTASSSEAYSFLFQVLCDPGDVVLVPRPSYPLFEYLARLAGVEPVSYDLAYDGEWHLLASSVERVLSPRVRAVVAVSPNNPTGSFLKRREAESLHALCAARELALIGDEVFADYAFVADPDRAGSLAQEGPALAFALGGLSKSCGLPQLKLGWIAVSGPEPRRREALARLELVADTYLGVSTPTQLAAPFALEQRSRLQTPIADRLATNLASLQAQFPAGACATLLRVEGGWSAVLQVPATASEEDWVAALVEHDGVLLHPGYFFDFPREAYLVLSLLPEPASFVRGVQSVRRRLEQGLPRGSRGGAGVL